MEYLMAFVSSSGSVIVAGMFGGAMRWALFRPKPWDGLLNIFVGGVLAFYIAPWAVVGFAPILSNFTSDVSSIHRFSGFTLGMGGVAAAGWLIDKFGWGKKKPGDVSGGVPSPGPAKE